MTTELNKAFTDESELIEDAPIDDSTETDTDNESVDDEGQDEEKKEDTEVVKKDKVQARINKVIREKHELQRANEELQRRLEGTSTPNYSPDVIESLVQEQASVIAKQNAFNERCNSIFNVGVEKYPDFGNSVTTLNDIGLQSNPELFNNIVDSDNPSDIMEYLANNLDEAEKFMDYSPAKMIRELTKLDIKLAGATAKSKPVSNAPAPIKPLSGKTAPVKVSAEKNAAAWIAQRNKELASKRK